MLMLEKDGLGVVVTITKEEKRSNIRENIPIRESAAVEKERLSPSRDR